MGKEYDNIVIRDRLKGALIGLLLGQNVKYKYDGDNNLIFNLHEPRIIGMAFCTQTILYIESYLNWLEEIITIDYLNPNGTDILIDAYDKWLGHIKGEYGSSTVWPQTEEYKTFNGYMHDIADWWNNTTEGKTEEDMAFYPIPMLGHIRDRAFFTAGAICSTTCACDFMDKRNMAAWVYKLFAKYYDKDQRKICDFSHIWLSIMSVIINIEEHSYGDNDEGKKELTAKMAQAGRAPMNSEMGYRFYVTMSEYAKNLNYPIQPCDIDIFYYVMRAFGRLAFARTMRDDITLLQVAPLRGMLLGFDRIDGVKNMIPENSITYIDNLVDRIIHLREIIEGMLSADNGRLRLMAKGAAEWEI